jgi:glycosyltransferase involved in cell wall biosynthesis
MVTFYINGKFTAQRTTGVQRVAAQLVDALDVQVEGRWVLLCPSGAAPPALSRIQVRCVGCAGLPLHLWEQVVLPWEARAGRLLNLAGSAPYFARRPAAILHDAAVFDHPEAYTWAFVVWYRRLFNRLARRALPLFTVSSFSRDRLALRLGVSPGRFTVLRNGGDHLDATNSDPKVIDCLGLRGKPFILAVGSANPMKNLPALLAAFAQLRTDSALWLVIVGGRNQQVFKSVRAQVDPPRVLRIGALEDAGLKSLYRHAMGLVFPSLYEGFGLPPMEAMANGCPVAAAKVASVPEVCGDAALYFDPRSVPDMTAALQRLFDDEPLRRRLRAAGRERVAAFRWQDSATVLLRALQDPDR